MIIPYHDRLGNNIIFFLFEIKHFLQGPRFTDFSSSEK